VPARTAAPNAEPNQTNADGLTSAMQWYVYDMTPQKVSVARLTDLESGDEPRYLYRQNLTADQRRVLEKFLRPFPLNEIQEEYRDPHMLEGMQITFVIRIHQGPQKRIYVAVR
jgi:hypothetical protein